MLVKVLRDHAARRVLLSDYHGMTCLFVCIMSIHVRMAACTERWHNQATMIDLRIEIMRLYHGFLG